MDLRESCPNLAQVKDHGTNGGKIGKKKKKVTQMYEYIFVVVDDRNHSNIINQLNEAGRDNWEFTGYTVDTGFSTDFLMKRSLERSTRGSVT